MLARDTQFVEMAVASGVLDPARARQIVTLRVSAPTGGEPIERWVVRHALARPDEVERIVAFAIARRSVAQDAATVHGEAPPEDPHAASVTFDPTIEAQRRAALAAVPPPAPLEATFSEASAAGALSSSQATFSEASAPPPPPSDATFSEASGAADPSATFGGDAPAAGQAEMSFAAPGLSTGFGTTPSGSVASAADATFWSEDGGAPAIAPSATPTARGPLGKRLGPYEILGEIARGGMGVVYRARREGDERVVALKLLLDETHPGEVLVRRFQREIRAGMEIDHPGVVKVFDSGTLEGRLYFAMEFIDGRPLQAILPGIDLPQRVALLEQVSRAVHAAHEKGYVHRDLKPHNILVTRDMVPKVADFGLAKSLDRQSRLTKTGAVLGTILYMSPEQATGGGEGLGRTTDVYSLGVMLYQALCGHVPFREGATHEMLKQILEKDPPDPRAEDPKIPAELVGVAFRALAKDPAKRFPTALVLADELRAWLEGEKLATAPENAVAKGARWARRHRLALGAVLGLVLIASVSAGALLFIRERARRERIEAERREIAAALAGAKAVLAKLAEPGPSTAPLKGELQAAQEAIERVRAGGTSPANAAEVAELEARRFAVEGALAVARGDEVREGAPAELELKLARAFETAPGRLDIRVAYAQALDLAGKVEEERALLYHACCAPGEASSASLLERLGACDLELGAPETAVHWLELALAHEPGLASARVLLGRALVCAGRADRALELLAPDDAGRKRELDERIVLDEALAARDPGAAIADLRRLERTTNEGDPELLRRTAELVLRQGRAEEAVASFGLAAAKAPRDPRPIAGMAEAYALAGDLGEACRELGRAAELARPGGSRRARCRAREVWLRGLLGDAPGAERVGREGLSEKPGDHEIEAALALGAALRGDAGARARLEAATSVADPAEAGGPFRARAVLALARLQLESGAFGKDSPPSTAGLVAGALLLASPAPDDDEALALHARYGPAPSQNAAVRAAHASFVGSGTSDGARFFRGSVLCARLAERFPSSAVDATRAETLLRLAEAAAPWAGAPMVERARRRLAAGEKAAQVRPLLEKGLALVGEDPHGLALLARTLLDEDEAGNAARAAEVVGRALAQRPGNAEALALRARAWLALGKSDDAARDVRASLDVARTDPAVWKLAAAIHEKQGRAEDAAKARREVADRTEPRRGQLVRALLERQVDDWRRALDLEPDHAKANYRATASIIYQLANGNEVSSEDPWLFLGRAVASTPAILNDCGGSGLKTVQNFGAADTAARYEEAKDDIPSLRVAATLRIVAIAEAVIDRKVVTKEMIDGARLDCERLMALDPAEVSAECLLGLLFAVERRPALGAAISERASRYFEDASLCTYAWSLSEATRGDKAKARALLARLKGLDDDLYARALETPEFQALDK